MRQQDIYNSLLDLTRQTELESADLHPRDRIDVQSFIWVVGFRYYKSNVPDEDGSVCR